MRCHYANWQALFKLRYEFRDDFFTFHSQSKGIVHRLKMSDSVAVTDEVFLKAYFSMAINAPELSWKWRNSWRNQLQAISKRLKQSIWITWPIQLEKKYVTNPACPLHLLLHSAGAKLNSMSRSRQSTFCLMCGNYCLHRTILSPWRVITTL